MDIITIDFESYYDEVYTLRNMTTQEYILDNRFEVILVGYKINNQPAKTFTGTHQDVGRFLKNLVDWSKAMLVCHNTLFDGAILAWRFDVHPMKYYCTMMGSRPNVVPFTHNGRMSLDAISKQLNLGRKGNAVTSMKGMRRVDFDANDLSTYSDYCINDVELCYEIFVNTILALSSDERDMIDLTLRKFIEPKLRLDTEVILDELSTLSAHKEMLLKSIGLEDRDTLMSNEKFAAALRNLGVEPPRKISPTTKRETYAFAKTDKGMTDLLEHSNPLVRLWAEARLAFKSTIEETRLRRFGVASRFEMPFAIPLLYYGAHTGRFSGLDRLNLQNLGRKSKLRHALMAPEGDKLVAGDLSQIEARITAALAGQQDLLDAFMLDVDVYSLFAGNKLYHIPPSEVTDAQRFIGKMCILGLGFGMGWPKFKETIRAMAGVDISDNEAEHIVTTYRNAYPMIVNLWSKAQLAIDVLANGGTMKIGPCIITKGKIELPNGMYIYYPELYRGGDGDYWYKFQGRQKKLYGGVLIENIVQALARIVLVKAELRLARRGIKAVMSVHDELVYCIKEAQAYRFQHALELALTAPVNWLPELPLAAEVKVGDRYSEVK